MVESRYQKNWISRDFLSGRFFESLGKKSKSAITKKENQNCGEAFLVQVLNRKMQQIGACFCIELFVKNYLSSYIYFDYLYL